MIQHEVRAGEGKQIVTAWLRENPSAGEEGDSLFLWQVTLPWRADDANFDRVLAFTASTGGLAQAVSPAPLLEGLNSCLAVPSLLARGTCLAVVESS